MISGRCGIVWYVNSGLWERWCERDMEPLLGQTSLIYYWLGVGFEVVEVLNLSLLCVFSLFLECSFFASCSDRSKKFLGVTHRAPPKKLSELVWSAHRSALESNPGFRFPFSVCQTQTRHRKLEGALVSKPNSGSDWELGADVSVFHTLQKKWGRATHSFLSPPPLSSEC